MPSLFNRQFWFLNNHSSWYQYDKSFVIMQMQREQCVSLFCKEEELKGQSNVNSYLINTYLLLRMPPSISSLMRKLFMIP
jgi:hypothetical protein